MKLVVCLDENNGIKFFGKRQSQDELQRKNLFELIGNLKLFLTEYSYDLYKDIEFNFEIIDENQEPEQELQSENQTMSASDEDAEEVYECPECGAPITIDMTVCPNCGVGLSFEYEDEE